MSLAGQTQTPAYIADDIQLVTDIDRRQLRSAAARTPRSTDAQQLRRSKLQCCRPARVEQFTAAPATRHELCAFQASTENISIWELVNHGASPHYDCLLFCALEILLLTYHSSTALSITLCFMSAQTAVRHRFSSSTSDILYRSLVHAILNQPLYFVVDWIHRFGALGSMAENT